MYVIKYGKIEAFLFHNGCTGFNSNGTYKLICLNTVTCGLVGVIVALLEEVSGGGV